MRDRLTAATRRITSTFGSFTPGQKAVTIVAVIALAVGGYFFATWASTPTLSPLFSNLAAKDASAIVEKLDAAGTQYELTGGGTTIMVPADQVYQLRLQMSGEGLPAESDGGYSLLDEQTVMSSDFQQQVSYRRAMEGELSKTIKSIDGVKAATVHLAIPQKDVFSDDAQEPSASVLVGTDQGKTLSSEQVQAVVHLVASSIEGMDPAKVTLVDGNGKVLSTGNGEALSGSAGGDQRTRATSDYEQRLSSSLQQMLDQVVGPGNAVVNITADLDFDSTETKTQTYVADPATPPLTESTKTETYSGSGTAVGGVLGPDNIQVPSGTGNGGAYQNSTSTKQNAVGMVTETRKSAPGAVRKLSVAVLLNDANVKGASETQLQTLVSSAVGLDAQRGDTIAVSTMAFDKSAADAAQSELADAEKSEKNEQLYSMIKTGATVGGILLLILIAAIGSRRRSKKLQKLLKAELGRFEDEQAALAGGEAIALEGNTAVAALEAGSDDPRSEKQREIVAMVEQQPEEVAALLRGWLADRRA